MQGATVSTKRPLNMSRDAGDWYGSPLPTGTSVANWLKSFDSPSSRFREALRLTYGDDPELIRERSAVYRSALSCFESVFGDAGSIVLVSVPSRINWEGHHVDHQGGHYNSTTHAREMVFAVRRRADARVRLANTNPERFSASEFLLSEPPPESDRRHCWSDYVRGAFEAIRRRCHGIPLLGADIAVASDIPVGASLSSSHALVLGSALCAIYANNLTLDKREAVILVQEGEWFTGSRTGLGDQASMVFGRRGKLFCSPVIERDRIAPRYVEVPRGYTCLIIDSYTEHHLKGEERIDYNARVFAYRTAFPLVLSAIMDDGVGRELVAGTCRLVDIAPDRFSTDVIYRALKRIPEMIDLAGARELFDNAIAKLKHAGVILPVNNFDDLVRTYFGTPPDSVRLPIRGVALYGLAECWRSRLFADLLERGEIALAGKIVDRGHDGDRVVVFDAKSGGYGPFMNPVTDEALDDLLARLNHPSEEVRASAALECQPGAYRASIQDLDELVDICRNAGAICASLTGAGLGGVVTTVIDERRVQMLCERLFDHFEITEDAEVELIRRAASDGLIDEECAAAAVSIRDNKRSTRGVGSPFVPSTEQQKALDSCVHDLFTGSNSLVRLLPVDYYRTAVARNVSVAGAGYLPAPN